MIIHRSPKDRAHPYTRISNAALRDKRLSLKARGLLAMILSESDGWDLSIAGLLVLQDQDGETSVRTAWAELLRHGYIRMLPRRRDAAGRMMPVEYEVFEEPQGTGTPHPDSPHVDSPCVGQPHVENRAQRTNKGENKQEEEMTKVELEGESLTALPSSRATSRPGYITRSTPTAESAMTSMTLAGHSIQEYQVAVDAAMAKNVAVIRERYWGRLDELVSRHKSFDDTFVQEPRIAWTQEELGYLREIVDFCIDQWPDRDPVDCTAQLVRAAFRRGRKAFQILKYWVDHGGKRVSLRPYIMLAGGQKNPDKRRDFLMEIAATIDTSETGSKPIEPVAFTASACSPTPPGDA